MISLFGPEDYTLYRRFISFLCEISRQDHWLAYLFWPWLFAEILLMVLHEGGY